MLSACVILNHHIVLHLTIVFACPSDVFEMDLHWKSLTILFHLRLTSSSIGLFAFYVLISRRKLLYFVI